jgi:hypothetical protein
MSTRVDVSPEVIIWVASTPSMPGMRISITTTSGSASLTSCTASAPVPASPATSISGVCIPAG